MSVPEIPIDSREPASGSRMPQATPLSSPLPVRGDRVATLWWQGGIAAYILLVGALLGGGLSGGAPALEQFIGRSSAGWNPTIPFVVLLSLCITVIMFVRARRDIAFLAREETDVEWLARNGASRVLFLLVPSERRAAALSASSQPPSNEWTANTLLSERVRRVYQALQRPDGVRPATEQLRFIAESRTGAYGQNVRYAAGLLLLLTVLGTFIGVKTALPALIRAVQNTDGGTLNDITTPLAAVAEAFGSNSIALIGAISLGIISQGFGVGRLQFLERLETVSEDVLFTSGGEAATQPLEAATRSLERAAQGLLDSQSSFEDIGSAIERLETTTRDAFGSLQGALAELGSKTDEEFFRHSARLFESVEIRLGRLEDAIAATAEVYGGMVSDVNRRAVETREAAMALAGANANLAQGLARHSDAAEALTTSSASIALASTEIQTAMHALQGTLDVIGTETAAMRAETAAMRVETANLCTELRTPRDNIAAELETPLAKLCEAVTLLRTGAQAASTADMFGQLRDQLRQLTQVVETQGQREGPSPQPAAPSSSQRGASDQGANLIVQELRSLGERLGRDTRRMAIDIVLWSATLAAALWTYVTYFRH